MKKKEFRESMSVALDEMRIRINGSFIPIGIATCRIIEMGEAVTKDRILEVMSSTEFRENKTLQSFLAGAAEQVSKLPPDPGVLDKMDAQHPEIGISDPVLESRKDREE